MTDLKGLPLFSGEGSSGDETGSESERASSSVAKAVAKAQEAVKAAEALAEPAPPKHLTVTELTTRIKQVLEPAFSQLWVQGEISNYRPAASGHAYFSLKDASSNVSAAIFGWGSMRAKRGYAWDLKDGMQVLCRGKISVYGPRGTYQLSIEQIEPLGAGALQVAFEALKAKLAAEKLFDPARKRALPRFPRSIAVVTSPSGAAIQDMLNILRRRAPHIRVRVIPALVQGEGAARQILAGLELANRHSLGEIIVLARGGGSIEDLWSFNDEPLARAISASRLPVISAVGHEIDFTIADFVADLRAPTPSAAAEIVSGHWVDSIQAVREGRSRLRNAMLRDLNTRKTLLKHVSARVISPRDRLREQSQRVDEITLRLERGLRMRLERRRSEVAQATAKLEALSPLRVLKRGYAIVHGAHGEVVKAASELNTGESLEIRFHDGKKAVQVI